MKSMCTSLLVGIITIASGNVSAMEVMAGDDLAEAIGQDGISIALILPDIDGAGPGTDLGISIGKLILHDSNGFAGAATAGAIQLGTGVVGDRVEIRQPYYTYTRFDFDMVGDAVAGGAKQPMLNIKITSPSMTLITGKIYAAASNGTALATTDLVKIMDSLTISSGGGVSNVQLANEAQGAMLVSNSTSVGGLNIANFVLYDVNSGGALNISNINITNTAGVDLDTKTKWDIGATGLFIQVDQFGTVAGGADVKMTNLKFGDVATPAIGNTEFVGLNLAGTIFRITGKL